jgi:hypothetical protein
VIRVYDDAGNVIETHEQSNQGINTQLFRFDLVLAAGRAACGQKIAILGFTV